MRHSPPNFRSFPVDNDKSRTMEGDESDFRGGGDDNDVRGGGDVNDVRGGGGGGAGRVFRRLATTRIRWPGDRTRCPRLIVLLLVNKDESNS
jgi:hypothetical protein